MSDPFIEISDYWLSITRRAYPLRGHGKWMLHSEGPHRLYQLLREEMLAGGLAEACSLKTRAEPRPGTDAVYLYSAPYTDREAVLGLAEELRKLDRTQDLGLVGPLYYKTDLHNSWGETLSRPGDGYHELLHSQNWIYQYKERGLVVNAAIEALHRALENPPENADPEFLLIRSLLPEYAFAGEERPKQ
jgi:hypothetical protein